MADTSPVSPPPGIPLESFILSFSDFQRASEDLISLLKAVDCSGWNLYEGPALQRALWRYETMWLPLLAAAGKTKADLPDEKDGIDPKSRSSAFSQVANLRTSLGSSINSLTMENMSPPLDVAWVWYIHRLSPLQYLDDVFKVVGCPLAPSILTAFEYGLSNESTTANIWNSAYAVATQDSTRVYFPDYLASIYNSKGNIVRRGARTGSVTGISFATSISRDISAGVKLHRGVLCLALRSEALYPGYLVRAIARYDDFIRLQAIENMLDLYPPRDVDFIWRVHAASTADYLNDDLIGRAFSERPGLEKSDIAHPQARIELIEHDEQVTAKVVSKQATEDIWNATYGNSKGPFTVEAAEWPSYPGQHRDGYLQDSLKAILDADLPEEDTDSSWDHDEAAVARKSCQMDSELARQATATSPSSPGSSSMFRTTIFGGRKGEDQREKSTRTSTSPLMRLTTDGISTATKGVAALSKLKLGVAHRKSSALMAQGGENRDECDLGTQRLGPREAIEATPRKGSKKKQIGDRHLAASKETLGHGDRLRKSQGLDRVQWIRGLSFCALGIVLVIFGMIYMKKLPSTSAAGVSLFMVGLLSFLSAALVWLRPDHERRKQHKEDRKRRREAKEADEKEKKESKANSKKYHDGIQMNSFASNEATVIIGGGELIHLPGASLVDTSV
jgi:Glycine-rich domain-containing protein-like